MSETSPRNPPWVVHAEDVPEVEGHYPAPFDAVGLVVGERRDEDRVFCAEDHGFDAQVAEHRPERWWRR